MFRFGFELEGFRMEAGEVIVPPKNYPTDGFPGLVEFRSIGGLSLHEAYAAIIAEMTKYEKVFTSVCEHTFAGKDRAELRRRYEVKSAWDIRNIYGKNPRNLGNKTIASLQVNVSNRTRSEYRDKEGILHNEQFGLFDVPTIVFNLDDEFSQEIREAHRQPGEYCIKDHRLEYRSLPNFVFPTNPHAAKEFLARIEKCVNE